MFARLAPPPIGCSVLLRCTRLLTVLLLCSSLGAHWFVLQSIAWRTMVFRYSQECSVTEALANTFDGEHPCGLCKHIQKSKNKSDQQPNSFSISKKIDLRFTAARPNLFPPTHFELQSAPDQRALIRTDTPPVPPPRA